MISNESPGQWPAAEERLYAVLFVPQFRLQAALPKDPLGSEENEEATPRYLNALEGEVALLDAGGARGLILEHTQKAAIAGVESGMAAAQALGRCPGLHLVDASAPAETKLSRRLLLFAQTLSPRVEQQAGDRFLLDLRGIRAACWEQWAIEAVTRLGRELEVKGVLGLAPRPGLAWCAARRANPVRVVRESEAFVETLTFGELEVSAPLQRVLSDWGMETLGDLLRLPRQAALERLGSEATALWEIARDTRESVLRLESFSEPLQLQSEFEHPVETLEPLLFTLNRFLEQLCSRMRLLHRVASSMRLRLTLENGPPYERTFTVPAPTREEAVLLRILTTHLETIQMEAPLAGALLQIQETLPSSQQMALFESPLRDPNRFGETLARLQALTGEHCVGVPGRGHTHRPGVHVLLDASKVFARDSENATRSPPFLNALPTSPALGVPLRRFRPPVKARVQLERHRPFHVSSGSVDGPVQECRGPYRLSGEWWERAAWSREEWDVSLGGTNRGLYRIACERTNAAENWLLEGCYDAGQWPLPPPEVPPKRESSGTATKEKNKE